MVLAVGGGACVTQVNPKQAEEHAVSKIAYSPAVRVEEELQGVASMKKNGTIDELMIWISMIWLHHGTLITIH